MDPAVLFFFEKDPAVLPIYEAFEARTLAEVENVSIRVQKTQITFSNRHVFACVSLARVRRKTELPDPYLVITLGLPYPLASERVAVKTEPYPGRWTTHIIVGAQAELDDQLWEWVSQAYNFALAK